MNLLSQKNSHHHPNIKTGAAVATAQTERSAAHCGRLQTISTEFPGFVCWQQQKDPIQCAARSLAIGMTSIVGATTGTGKSFGYQMPGRRWTTAAPILSVPG